MYFLLSKDDNNEDTIYIGKSEKMLIRIKQHLRNRNYWNNCIAVISKDNLLNKAHVKYLENKFYMIAQKSGRAVIVNNSVPTCSSISEFDEAMLEEFISNTKLLVNTLGYKVFDSIEESSVRHENEKIRFLITAARGADACGVIVSDGFAVFKNSTVSSSVVPSMPITLLNLRNSLYGKGIIDP